jgi:hypothetical protein
MYFSAAHSGYSAQAFVEKVKVAFSRQQRRPFDKPFEGIFLIGHTAAGKSRLLTKFNLDRHSHDLDLFCGKINSPPSLEVLNRWLRCLPCIPNIRVLSNDIGFLERLVINKYHLPLPFAYLKRSRGEIYENIHKVNTDGCRHIIPKDMDRWYDIFDSYYLQLADVIIQLEDDIPTD